MSRAAARALPAPPPTWVRWDARTRLPARARRQARRAARSVLDGLEVLARRGLSPVSALVGDSVPAVLAQYPAAAPVQGPDYLYYYHCHDARETPAGEHGHFHVFARRADGRHVHLAGVAVDAVGWPRRLFTTNRWVTDEVLVPAAAVLAEADRLAARAYPDPLTRWLLPQLALFRPQLAALLQRRDLRLRALRRGRSRQRLLEDRRIRVLSQCRIDLPAQIAALSDPT